MTLTEETPVDTIRESAPPNSSLTQLFSGIISDAQLLFKQQVELIRAELDTRLEQLRLEQEEREKTMKNGPAPPAKSAEPKK